MDQSNIKPGEEEKSQEPENPAITESSGDEPKRERKRRRIKVRKRIRIKKRVSKKKKAKKTLETVAWVVIIAAFLMTLIMLILQLDLTDKRTKKSQGKEVSMIEMVPTDLL